MIALLLGAATAAIVLVIRALTDLIAWWRRWVVRHDDIDASTMVANLHRIADPDLAPAAEVTEVTEVVLRPSGPHRMVDLTPTRPRHSPKRCAPRSTAPRMDVTGTTQVPETPAWR